MHADGSVEIRIGRPQDGGGRTAGRQSGDVHPGGVDRELGHDLAGDAGDQRKLAPIPLLAVRRGAGSRGRLRTQPSAVNRIAAVLADRGKPQTVYR